MSSEKPYTDKDSEQFANLMPSSKNKSIKPGRRSKLNVPDIQTRVNYTDKDLEKFEKMFSAGFAPTVSRIPEQNNEIIAKSSKSAKKSENYQASDQDQFEKLIPNKSVKKPAGQTSSGGKISNSKPRSLYNQTDQEQFDQILDAGLKTFKKPSSDEHEKGSHERNWRFPDLHQNSQSELSATRNGIGEERLNIERPGKGRIKLRYFE